MTHSRYGEREPLTVGRLIDLLRTFHPELPVVVDGYEGGVGRLCAEMVRTTVAVDESKGAHDVVYLEREGSPDQGDGGLFHNWDVES